MGGGWIDGLCVGVDRGTVCVGREELCVRGWIGGLRV